MGEGVIDKAQVDFVFESVPKESGAAVKHGATETDAPSDLQSVFESMPQESAAAVRHDATEPKTPEETQSIFESQPAAPQSHAGHGREIADSESEWEYVTDDEA